jgi:DNA-binding NarL/FixJ family response regulator
MDVREADPARTCRTSVLVVDDDASYRAVVRINLELDPRLRVVGEASDGAEAIELCETLRPDVVVLDLDMPYIGGAAAADAISEICPDSRIVILTAADDVRPARRDGRRLVLRKSQVRVDRLAAQVAAVA